MNNISTQKIVAKQKYIAFMFDLCLIYVWITSYVFEF